MSKKQGTKKLLYAALAAIAGGGILYAVFKNREEDEKDTKKIKVGPSTGGTATGTDQDSTIDETITEGSGGGGGVGGGGGGGGLGEGLRMCLGLNEEAERDVKYVAEGEECPVEFPYDTEEQVEEAQYDAFRCYDIDENNELVEQEKALEEKRQKVAELKRNMQEAGIDISDILEDEIGGDKLVSPKRKV